MIDKILCYMHDEVLKNGLNLLKQDLILFSVMNNHLWGERQKV